MRLYIESQIEKVHNQYAQERQTDTPVAEENLQSHHTYNLEEVPFELFEGELGLFEEGILHQDFAFVP